MIHFCRLGAAAFKGQKDFEVSRVIHEHRSAGLTNQSCWEKLRCLFLAIKAKTL